ncbi:MAG: HEAT repeat domain-containing protein [Vicinamibacterales bacterium]
MVIKSSAARDIGRLVGELTSDDEIRREAAVARLAIIGPRAVGRLVETLGTDPPAPARAAILRALEAIGDRRALAPALERLTDSDPRASHAAVAVVRRFLRSQEREAAGAAFEGLTALALDRARPTGARLAALEALDEIPGSSAKMVRERLAEDPSPVLRTRAAGPWRTASAARQPRSLETIVGRLPEDPEVVRAALHAEGGSAPLATLGHLVDSLREREASARRAEERAAWRAARGAAHQALGARNSRLALYDLRETLADTSEPLPVGFVAAIEAIGDGSCLEAVARAWSKAKPHTDSWWRRHLDAAFRAIVRRERLTRRSAALKRALARWPLASALVDAASTPSRTTPRRRPTART